MGYRLVRHPYALALEEAARAMMPGDEVFAAIFCSVMKAAGIPYSASSQLLSNALRETVAAGG